MENEKTLLRHNKKMGSQADCLGSIVTSSEKVMTDFNLVYHCKKTGKKVLAKKLLMDSQYKVLDPETSEVCQMSQYALRKLYKCDKKNRAAVCKKYAPKGGKASLRSKAYRNYLSGVEV